VVYCFVEDEHGNRWSSDGTDESYIESLIDTGSIIGPELVYPENRKVLQ
jgi:hypothetical protein